MTLTAVVTGANRGIGFEIVRQLAQRGVHVVLTARDEQAAAKAAATLQAEMLSVSHHPLDVTSQLSVDRLVDTLQTQIGTLDILINNAGIFPDRHLGLLDLDLNTFQQTMDTNLYGPFRLVKALLPLMQKSPAGRIVNISSGLGALEDMGPGFIAYSVSKTALNALTVKMAYDLLPYGIVVNCMCPGWVRTEMGGAEAPRTVEQGADTAIYLALEDVGVSGCFFSERKIRHW